MASLVGIPPELMGLICSELATGDILRLCRSCKALYSAAHPLLFRHVTVKWDCTAAAPDEPPNLTSLLLFILRHPDYAKYIWRVDISDLRYIEYLCFPRHVSAKGSPWCWSPEETVLLKAVIEECGLPHANEWYTAVVEEANLGAIIALIVAQCTHLKSLTVDMNFLPPCNTFFPDVIRRALSAPEGATRLSSFNKLTHVTVTEVVAPGPNPQLGPELEEQLDLPAQATLLFFYLPSVTSIHFSHELYNEGEKQPWDPRPEGYHGLAWPLADPPLAVSLTKLRLDFTVAPADLIKSLLRHTPNLKSLDYNCHLPSSVSPLDLSALRQGLHHVRNTLERLGVGLEIFADEALDPENLVSVVQGSLGPLGFLDALEDLQISLGVLFGQVAPESAPPLADVLPPRLKRLVINDDLCSYDAFSEWQGEPNGALLSSFFAGACKTATPLLKDFWLDMGTRGWVSYEQWEYWFHEGNHQKLQQLIESQGIRCDISLGGVEE